MVILVTHGLIREGFELNNPSSSLVKVLRVNKVPYVLLKHSLSGEGGSNMVLSLDGKNEKVFKLLSRSIKINWLRYLLDIVITILVVIYVKVKYGAELIYIGLDPLNAVSGVFLKFVGVVKKTVFFSVDYTTNRFENKILNNIYQYLDKFCSNKSNEVWNVSTRILEMRLKMGIDKNRLFFIPNTPAEEFRLQRKRYSNKYHIVSLGPLSGQLDYDGLFYTLVDLKKVYPDILLKIIGTGCYEESYKKLISDLGISDNVLFKGLLSHPEAMKEIASSGVGLALYNGSWSFNYYGDSMKCREYLFYGLPVLTTNTHSTVKDILGYKAGVVVGMNPKEYAKGLSKIFDNYDLYSKNSYKLGRKYDDVRKENVLRLLEI